MLALPDYIVLDFLEWISQNYLENKIFMDSLLNDKDLIMSYAKKYLNEENKHCKDYYMQRFKRHLKRYINLVIDSKEFDESLGKHFKYRNYHSRDHWLLICYCELKRLLHDRFEELSEFSGYELDNVEPYDLVNALYFYLDKNGVKDNSELMHFMVGCSSKDLSVILDFFNWLKEQNKSINFYKMPKIVFKDIIGKYESTREIKLNNKVVKYIIKSFSTKSPNQINEWLNKVFGKRKIRNLSDIFERYYKDTAKYKCILLPLKGESELKKFIKKYWYDLDAASSDWLDIFYSFKELENTGYISLDKIRDLSVDVDMLPCIVIWQKDIFLAKSISIRKLSHSDLYELLSKIISFIKEDMDLEQIYSEAIKKVKILNEDSRMIQKIEQNINGTNYGPVTGINKGKVKSVISSNNQNIQNDIQQAKEKIKELKELNSDMMEFLYELLDEAGSSILKDDNKLKDECVNKFKGFMIGAGKVSAAILDALGSITSIASFFGIG